MSLLKETHNLSIRWEHVYLFMLCLVYLCSQVSLKNENMHTHILVRLNCPRINRLNHRLGMG